MGFQLINTFALVILFALNEHSCQSKDTPVVGWTLSLDESFIDYSKYDEVNMKTFVSGLLMDELRCWSFRTLPTAGGEQWTVGIETGGYIKAWFFIFKGTVEQTGLGQSIHFEDNTASVASPTSRPELSTIASFDVVDESSINRRNANFVAFKQNKVLSNYSVAGDLTLNQHYWYEYEPPEVANLTSPENRTSELVSKPGILIMQGKLLRVGPSHFKGPFGNPVLYPSTKVSKVKLPDSIVVEGSFSPNEQHLVPLEKPLKVSFTYEVSEQFVRPDDLSNEITFKYVNETVWHSLKSSTTPNTYLIIGVELVNEKFMKSFLWFCGDGRYLHTYVEGDMLNRIDSQHKNQTSMAVLPTNQDVQVIAKWVINEEFETDHWEKDTQDVTILENSLAATLLWLLIPFGLMMMLAFLIQHNRKRKTIKCLTENVVTPRVEGQDNLQRDCNIKCENSTVYHDINNEPRVQKVGGLETRITELSLKSICHKTFTKNSRSRESNHTGSTADSIVSLYNSSRKNSSKVESWAAITLTLTELIDSKHVDVLEEIGSGSYGAVYKGEFSGIYIALKKIHSWKIESCLEDFKNEVKLAMSLRHPNILQFIGVTVFSDLGLCSISEFMERGDLLTVLQNDSKSDLTWENIKHRFAIDVAAGLAYLHLQRPAIMHRDLKSRNILVGQNFNAKLCDFGLSRAVSHTSTMTVVGSNLWLAPEMTTSGVFSEKADIFSFGIVLSEIDTGILPYTDAVDSNGEPIRGGIAILHNVAYNNLRPKLSEDCPNEIRNLVDRCTKHNPDDRPSSIDILHELQEMKLGKVDHMFI